MRVASFTSLSHATTIDVTELVRQGGYSPRHDVPTAFWGGWVGDINMGWPDFLARCLIETASSRHGGTAAGCDSIAALGSYPTKEDRSRSDIRQPREARDLRRDRNIERDSPSFWSSSHAGRDARSAKARRLIASSVHDT